MTNNRITRNRRAKTTKTAKTAKTAKTEQTAKTEITAILCAIEPEMAPFMRALNPTGATSRAMMTVHEGTIDGMAVVLARCGVCKVNAAVAAQVLIDTYGVSRMIMSGTAGGVDQRLRIGDTVVSTEAVYHDVLREILTKQHPYLPEPIFPGDAQLLASCRRAIRDWPIEQGVYFGRVATGEAFITTEGRDDIIAQYHPLCVDMETAAAAHVCYVNSVPFLAVRSVTDTEAEPGDDAFRKNVCVASEHSFAVVRALLNTLSENAENAENTENTENATNAENAANSKKMYR